MSLSTLDLLHEIGEKVTECRMLAKLKPELAEKMCKNSAFLVGFSLDLVSLLEGDKITPQIEAKISEIRGRLKALEQRRLLRK